MSNLPSSTDKTRTLSTYGLSVREERRAAVAVDASFGAEELVDAGVRAMALPALLAVAAVVGKYLYGFEGLVINAVTV